MCRVIAVSNQKGGVGKTVSCVNLGIGLAQSGKKVLLIDADPQGSMTISLGYPEPDDMEYSLASMMMNIVNDEPLNIDKTILHHKEGVDLIPANIELSAIEVSLVNVMSRELILRTLVEQFRKFYDFIIIDCMPSLGMMTINAMACADSVLIPVQAAYLPVKGLQQLIKTISRVKKQLNPKNSFLSKSSIILIFPSTAKDNKTVRVLKTPKTESSIRKVFIPRSVALCLKELKQEQDDLIDALGSEYHNYNLVMATTFGYPISGSYLREKMQKVIDEQGLPDVVFHSLRHTSVTYKLKLSGGDIKAVQGDSGHAQADMVTEVYGHILDEDRRKNAELIESAFYNKENLSPNMHGQEPKSKTVSVPDGVDTELLMKVLENPEMAALLTSLAKTMKV